MVFDIPDPAVMEEVCVRAEPLCLVRSTVQCETRPFVRRHVRRLCELLVRRRADTGAGQRPRVGARLFDVRARRSWAGDEGTNGGRGGEAVTLRASIGRGKPIQRLRSNFEKSPLDLRPQNTVYNCTV